ncbi:MAG: long-chain acyl-CoA synthetase [Methylobacteriaceae bacterium]|nr:long-chain acyl-CoA synthetase [Methylobacteriaceae bacterium]
MMHPSLHALITPDKIAYQMAGSGEAITYRELDEVSNRAAQLFRALDLRAQNHIALLIENSLRFLEICWAAQRCGLLYTAISTHLTDAEIAYIVRDCGAKIFVLSSNTGHDVAALAELCGPDVKTYVSGETKLALRSWDETVAKQPAAPIRDEICGYDMLYSSGTTGRPKGVKPQFKNEPLGSINPLLVLLCAKMCGMDRETTYLSPAPLYHAAPLRFNIMSGALGGTSIIMEKFDPEQFLALIEKHRATVTQVVPTMFVRLLKLPDEVRRRYDTSSLRAVIHAAAPCPVDVKAAMIDWWGPILVEYYGGTEGNGITIVNSQEWLAHPGTVGRTLVGEIKILDESGRPLPPREIGGVYFSGGPVFAYHNDPQKTESAYTPEGWSTLGDVGYLDEEGYLYLTDRKAYMIISGGVNIYPQEAENVLITHPAVLDVAVFGVPNEEMGEEVKAVVQLAPGASAGETIKEELIAFCRSKLSPFKCPRSIDFEDELPRTPTGKLMKRLLRDRYWQAVSQSRPAATTQRSAPGAAQAME